MAVPEGAEAVLAAKFAVMRSLLGERQWRVYLGSEARARGHGGIAAVARAAGCSESTVAAGVAEIEAGELEALPPGRSRRPGGGRKKAEEAQPGLKQALAGLLEAVTRGDPMVHVTWCSLSLREIGREMAARGFRCGRDALARMMHQDGYSLQGMSRTAEGKQHPDRDAQFRHIDAMITGFRAAGDPVVSVDGKKKEQLGPYWRAGRSWRGKGDPVKVRDHDFPDEQLGKITPYGVYDIAANRGFVSVGTSRDTAAFAVSALRLWEQQEGSLRYRGAKRLLVTCDAGGSNSYTSRLWKDQLAVLAQETGLEIHVCHFPPGTSKWNKIEHRLFSQITMNWRGRPLTSHEVVVQTIAATRTSRGLHVEAVLDPGDYPTGVAISKERFAALPLERHTTHGAWNYTLRPAAATPAVSEGTTGQPSSPARRRQEMLARLSDERLTGMTGTALARLRAALAPLQAARAQQRYSQQRGGRARRATGNVRGRPLFDDAARLLLTLLYQRQACSMNVLADLLEVTATCIGDLVKETREILEDHGHDPGAAPVRFTTCDALLAFADSDLRPARATVIEQLSRPALTGLTRRELHDLTRQLAPLQAARAERFGYQRRGGPRQPNARGGVFHQKISNGERVLLAILYQRRLCTMDVLASLLDVCRSSIGNAIRETLPLLDQAGHVTAPAPARYRTSSDLMAATASSPDSPPLDTAS